MDDSSQTPGLSENQLVSQGALLYFTWDDKDRISGFVGNNKGRGPNLKSRE